MITQLWKSGMGHTYVKGSISNGKTTVNGYYLLDTCASTNFLYRGMIKPLNLQLKKSSITIDTFNHKGLETEEIEHEITIEGTSFEEDFYLFKEPEFLFDEKAQIIGVLGVPFMRRYGMIIDYQAQKLYTPDNEMASKIAKFTHVSPFNIGLEEFCLPAVGIKNDKESICLAVLDTGSTINIMTDRILHDMDLKYTDKSKSNEIVDAYSATPMSVCDVEFGLVVFSMKEQELVFSHYNLEFNICSDRDFFKTNENAVLAVLLGNEFLRKNKCIIDFHNSNIYFDNWG